MENRITAIRAELQELRGIEEATEEARRQGRAGFAISVAESTLAARREELQHRLAEALHESGATSLTLAFDGGPVEGQGIDILFLAQALERVQKTVSAIGQATFSYVTKRGQIRSNIIVGTALRAVATSAGSFCVQLAAAPAPNVLGESIIEESLQAFDELLAAGDDPGRLTEVLARLGPRVQNRYDDLLESLAGHDAQMRTRWISATDRRVLERTMAAPLARRTREALALIRREERESRSLRGVLVGLRQMRQDFEFVPDGTPGVLHGRVGPSALAEAVRLYNQHVLADFEVEITLSEGTDECKEEWTLVSVCSEDL